MNQFDAVVMGGGLAGSCAAYHLARRGATVALLEGGQFPRHKVCGEFLSPESRKVFGRLGVENRLFEMGAREVFFARLFVPDGRFVEVPLSTPALAISRYALDEILWKNACVAGAQGFDNSRVRSVEKNEKFRVLTSRGEFYAQGVIEARGRVARETAKTGQSRYFGLKTHWRGAHLESGVTELHVFEGGYCGLVRIEGDLTNVCLLARYDCWARSGAKSPGELFLWICQQCPALAKRVSSGEMAMPWLATGNIAFHSDLPLKESVLRCGDASGFIHPLTGDGMAMALRGGELAAVSLAVRLRGGISEADAEHIYCGAWRRELAPRLGWARGVAPLFLSPSVARAALPVAQKFPFTVQFLLNKTRG